MDPSVKSKRSRGHHAGISPEETAMIEEFYNTDIIQHYRGIYHWRSNIAKSFENLKKGGYP